MTFLIYYNHPNSKIALEGDKYWNNKNASLKIIHTFLSKKILFSVLICVGFTATANAEYIDKFSLPYVLDALTDSQIKECESIYDDFNSLSDLDFYTRYQIHEFSGNCVMLYEDSLWDYDDSDRYEKLSERSAELIQERETELKQSRDNFYINSRSVTELQIPGTFLFEFEGCTGDQTINASDISVVSDKETVLLTKFVGEERTILPGSCNLLEVQIRADDPSSIKVVISSLDIEVPAKLDESINEVEPNEVDELQIIHKSPRAQMNSGIAPTEVACRENFVLMVRESGSPACLTPASYLRSVDRGWGVADLDLMEKHPEQLDAIIATIMQNRELREQVIERISANPEALEKIKGNEKLMNVLEGKGMVGEGQAGTQMGGMFGSSETGKQMGDMMSSMGFNMGGDSKMGNMIGGMVDKMMGSMSNGMENSPSMGAQMRTNDGLMGMLFG
jgi:hypothetical protein